MSTLPCPACGANHQYEVGSSVNGAVEIHFKCGRRRKLLYFLTAKGELHFPNAIQDGKHNFSPDTVYLKPKMRRKRRPRDKKFEGIANPVNLLFYSRRYMRGTPS